MVPLRDKFRGCIAASWVGSAMGAAVEGWPPDRIRQTHGRLDRLVEYKHYTDITDWLRAPGTTEDGIERQKLFATAIIEKPGRIEAHDLVAVWLRDLDGERMKYKQEAFDRSLLALARGGVPPCELGRLFPYANVVSMARSSHPLGLINAGDPQGAADDSVRVGKVYAAETSFTLRWAGLYNAAIAAACRPDATVESVLAVAREFIAYHAQAGGLYTMYDTVQHEVDRALELARTHADDEDALREAFARHYHGGAHVVYGMSLANEIVSKGLAVFAVSEGDPKRAILTAVNFGRDTDCLAAVAGGLAGALSGPDALPDEWIDQVNQATAADPYTNNRRTIEQTADGLFEAFGAGRKRLADHLERMGDEAFLA